LGLGVLIGIPACRPAGLELIVDWIMVLRSNFPFPGSYAVLNLQAQTI